MKSLRKIHKSSLNETALKPYAKSERFLRVSEVVNSMSLLVIDPNNNFRRMLCLALEATGYTACAVSDGDAALAYLQATHTLPDVIISELALPDWEYTEFLDILRRNARTEAVPVIMMAVRDNSPDRKTAIQHGANAFLVKPFTFADLSSILERWGLRPSGEYASCAVS